MARAQRVFVAVMPPRGLVADAFQAMRAMDLPVLRRSPGRQVHLTLHFAGDRSARELPALIESLERAASGVHAFELQPGALVTLPRGAPSRQLALLTSAPGGLVELVSRLTRRLARRPRARPADRYEPRMTLCELRHSGVELGIESEFAAQPFEVSEIVCMRTITVASRVEHREVARCSLR